MKKGLLIFGMFLFISLNCYSATRDIVPNADEEGALGDASYTWATAEIQAITCETIDTGNGASEVYNCDQSLLTTDNVDFNGVDITTDLTVAGAVECATIDTGQGAYEVYSMNQDVESTDAVTFATVDTGQGANELYDMDQNVLTSSTVTFANLSVSTNIAVTGNIEVTGSLHEENGRILAQDLKNVTVTITSPLDLVEDALLPIIKNRTGRTMTIVAIYSSSDTDDVNFTLKSAPYNDYTSLTTIEAIEIATDGTSIYYNDLTSGIDSTSVPNANDILFDNDATDEPDYVSISITYYLT